jgi:hypothetical protein
MRFAHEYEARAHTHSCVANAYAKGNDSVCYPYGGYSGNVLFSRSQLKNATTRSLAQPNFFNSDAIFATSSFSGVGNVNLYTLPRFAPARTRPAQRPRLCVHR